MMALSLQKTLSKISFVVYIQEWFRTELFIQSCSDCEFNSIFKIVFHRSYSLNRVIPLGIYIKFFLQLAINVKANRGSQKFLHTPAVFLSNIMKNQWGEKDEGCIKCRISTIHWLLGRHYCDWNHWTRCTLTLAHPNHCFYCWWCYFPSVFQHHAWFLIRCCTLQGFKPLAAEVLLPEVYVSSGKLSRGPDTFSPVWEKHKVGWRKMQVCGVLRFLTHTASTALTQWDSTETCCSRHIDSIWAKNLTNIRAELWAGFL